MTFQTLKDILIKENVSTASFDILGCGHVTGEDGFVVQKSSKGYNVYYEERGNKTFLAWFSNEHETCMEMLRKFIACGEKQLQKHIQ